ncbi:MAG: hypothetical protein JXR31_04660 [Prolixibacteraceae bacterium]|nr:hypothetical protein [Prolixibacteraceae bacterium]MBN2773516.1 hypothetical protein [Prolixibacteraceae bacterium]
MKTKSFFIFSVFLLLTTPILSQNKIVLGLNYVHRFIDSYEDYCYPRFTTEYQISRSSSFELLAEYINLRNSHDINVISYPVSIGFKLNYLPWFSKNEKLNSAFKLYNSVRYVLLLDNQKNYTGHFIRYAPGIDVFIDKNWGLNGEMVFGNGMRTTVAFGIKYRF